MKNLRTCSLEAVRDLCERFHAYGGAGNTATYAFAVIEDGAPVAAWAWQPPPPGAALTACPSVPAAVLSLSRMVAVEKADRDLVHISKPLKIQMRRLIDRTRWPVLVTFSDEGQGHTGHVYKCSGWQKTTRRRVPVYVDEQGRRTSSYSAGAHVTRSLTRDGWTWIQRWEHRACAAGEEAAFMAAGGWRRVATGKKWRSGAPAYQWVKESPQLELGAA